MGFSYTKTTLVFFRCPPELFLGACPWLPEVGPGCDPGGGRGPWPWFPLPACEDEAPVVLPDPILDGAFVDWCCDWTYEVLLWLLATSVCFCSKYLHAIIQQP